MRLLITGGAGFIGTHVAKGALSAGHDVRILDNLSSQVHGEDGNYSPPEGAQFVCGDVRSRTDWQRALEGVDAVVHLAAETGTAQSMYEIDRYYQVNVQGTALLFDMLASGDHQLSNVVLSSSRSVYGEGAYMCRSCGAAERRRFPRARSREQLESNEWEPKCPACHASLVPVATREEDPVSPASIYAATKLAQEELVRVACSASGLMHSILRLQNVYGEGQSLRNPYTGILSIFSTRVRLGLPLPIFEDGRESRDFVYVGDVAEVILHCVENPQAGETLNVGSGKAAPILDVARSLARSMGSEQEPYVTGEFRVGDIRHNFANIDKLKRLTGLSPQTALNEGLQRFCGWVASQPIPDDLLDKANAELKSRDLMR